MRKTPYLIKRGQIFWWRRRLPTFTFPKAIDAKALLTSETANTTSKRPRHLAISLTTTCQKEARRRVAYMNVHFEDQVQRIETISKTESAMSDQQLHLKIMADLAETMRSQAKLLEENQTELRRVQVASSAMASVTKPDATAKKSTHADGHAKSQLDDPAFERALMDIAEQEGWWHDNPDDIVEQFDMMLAGLVTLQEEYIRYCVRKKIDPADALPSLSKLGSSLNETAKVLDLNVPPRVIEKKTAQTESLTPSSIAKIVEPGPLFSDHAARFIKLRSEGYDLQRHHETPDAQAGRSFIRTSRANFEGTIRLFLDIVGDLPVGHIDETHIHQFIAILDRIPSRHGKSSKNKRTILEQVEYADRQERNQIAKKTAEMAKDGLSHGEVEEVLTSLKIARLRTNTCVRHIQAIAQICKFSIFAGHASKNPVDAVKWTQKEINRRLASETDAERLPWGDHLPTLLCSPIYRNPLMDPGDPMFWAPLLALFAGLRLEEALQLRIDDITTLEDVPVIYIQISSATQTVKSNTSKRPIPIHSSLLELGFLEIVELRRSQRVNRLFTNLPRGQSKDKLGEVFSKRFTHYRKKCDIYEPRRDFHSLRKDFLTKLIRAGVPERAYKTLMGHEFTDVTHKHYYPDGDSPEMMENFINRIHVDISKIRRPFGHKKLDENVTQFPADKTTGMKNFN